MLEQTGIATNKEKKTNNQVWDAKKGKVTGLKVKTGKRLKIHPQGLVKNKMIVHPCHGNE